MRRISMAFALMAVGVGSGCALSQGLMGFGSAIHLQGAIFTTDVNGTHVNQNQFDTKDAVYVDGGPQHPGAAGLPDGTYVLGVTDPSGDTLLSPLPLKTVDVSSGEFDHRVQLAPFDDSANGVYKVWATLASGYPASGPGVKSGFKPSESRTDNFRVLASGTSGSGGGTGGGGDGDGGSDGDVDGNGCPDSYGAVYGDIFGDIHGDIYGDLYGTQFGNLYGNLYGNRLGDMFGDQYGDQYGDFYGDQFGNRYGNLYGTMYGDTFGNDFGDLNPGGGCP